MDGGTWQATYSPWGHKESDMAERLHFTLGVVTPDFLGLSAQCAA